MPSSSNFTISKTLRFSVIQLPGQNKNGKPAKSTAAPATSTIMVPAGGSIEALQAAVVKQGTVVKTMKKDGAAQADIQKEVAKLQALKAKVEAALKSAGPAPDTSAEKRAVDDLLLRRMFVVPAFEIHGGVAGLFDLGPPACALKANVVDQWRRHFVLEENMLEMECTCMTPEPVLKTSGHVDKFTDLMVKDLETGECFRADKLLEDFIDKLIDEDQTLSREKIEDHRRVQRQADAYSPEELHKIFGEYGIVSPTTGNVLTEPFAFNLMFKTSIGPEGTSVGYLRPETAQGLFVNFKRLIEFNGQKMPFAAAQVGLGFRNEISPRAGLLRVREFCMAEIEHFVNPADKTHPKFERVQDKVLELFCREDQMGSGQTRKLPIGAAVQMGMVNNQTLGYFMTRTQLFMEKIGLDPGRLRFRQHLSTEMAHYAADCWDLEIKTLYGWVECVGHADRACYDLQVHAQKTNVPMMASQIYKQPKEVLVAKMDANKKLLGMTFKQEQKKVVAALEALTEDLSAVDALDAKLAKDGQADVEGYTVTRDMVKWKKAKKMVQEEKYVPSVIEPSFGIGRILYALMEHSFYQRASDEQRAVMSFPALVAPIKCGVFSLSSNESLINYTTRVADVLTTAGVANKVDTASGSLGRRYARTDELGTPFGITIDFETLVTDTVTLRERDSTAQIRVPVSEVAALILRLCAEGADWGTISRKYPLVRTGDEDEEKNAEPKNVPTIVEVTPRGQFSRPNPNYKPPTTVVETSLRGAFSRPKVPIL